MVQANDGWLGKSAGPYQHFELARLRAIENRVPIVRSGNTGISGIIMSNGEVKKKIPLGEQVVFKEKIILGEAGSFYTKYGDVFASLCFVILLFVNPVLLCLKIIILLAFILLSHEKALSINPVWKSIIFPSGGGEAGIRRK